MTSEWITEFIYAMIRSATPLIFGALGVLLAERAGVVFVSVEGVMLIGGLVAVLATSVGGSLMMGVLFTILVGAVLGLLLAMLMVWLPTDQMVVGIAFNMVALGLSSYIFRLNSDYFKGVTPAISPVFLQISPFALAAVLFALLIWYFFYRTGPGLKLRSLGESAISAQSAGLNVLKIRTITLIFSGILCALGGAALTIAWTRTFTENITHNRGFIALAAVYFGKWNPVYAVLGTLLFAAGEAIGFRSQAFGSGMNPYYLSLLPYLLTIFVIGLSGRSGGPAEIGKPYMKE